MTQKRGGPIASKITLEPVDGIKLAGEFTPDKAPETHPEPAFNDLPVETHEGQVIWSAPLDVSSGVDLATARIAGKLSYQACDASSCRAPTSVKFTAVVKSDAAPAPHPAKESTGGGGAAMPGTYQTKTAHALIRGYVTPAVGAAGQQGKLVITVEPIGGYHVYALADHDPKRGSKPTLIVLDETSGLKPATPAVAGKLIEKASAVTPGETDQYYEQSVTWTIDLSIPQGAKAGEYPLAGLIGFQTCREETGCDLPHGVAFSAVLPITATSSDGKIPLTFSPAKSYKQVADLAAKITAAAGQPAAGAAALDLSQLQPDTPKASEQSLTKMMGYGFLAGMILNLMPCVLPVIGLKILSFVEQSGQERACPMA